LFVASLLFIRLIKEIEMPRNKLGQFEPGTCGNARGRPRKLPPQVGPRKVGHRKVLITGVGSYVNFMGDDEDDTRADSPTPENEQSAQHA